MIPESHGDEPAMWLVRFVQEYKDFFQGLVAILAVSGAIVAFARWARARSWFTRIFADIRRGAGKGQQHLRCLDYRVRFLFTIGSSSHLRLLRLAQRILADTNTEP